VPTAGWPLLALGISAARFGGWPAELDGHQLTASLAGFVLVGALSGSALILLLRRTPTTRARAYILAGYTAAIPFAYGVGLLAPLLLPPGISRLSRSAAYLILFPAAVGAGGGITAISGMLFGRGLGTR